MAHKIALSLLLAILVVNKATADIILEDDNGTSPQPETTTETLPVVTSDLPDYSVTCTFETDLCGWIQNTKDDFDWTRHRGSTSSSATGPSNDHTFGFSAGHYMYIEASSPRKPGDTAELNYVFPQAVTDGCITLFYNMYGSSIGALEVELVSVSGNRQTIMSKTSAQGLKWKKAQLSIPGQTKMVSIKGVVGPGVTGDIAIDDVTLSTTSCPQEPFNCTFDADLCGWKQEGGNADSFDWAIRSGATGSAGTGPTRDRAGNGNYLYIEASQKQQYQFASISNTFVKPVDQGCFSLYYHMYGSSIGSLRVRAEGVDANATTLWSLSGNQGNAWHRLNIPIKQLTKKLTIIGSVGFDYHGDIAIDDIIFTPTSCPGDIITFGKCPKSLSVVADAATGVGVFDIRDDKSSHQLTLPVGRYPHVWTTENGAQCYLTLIVYDGRIAERLVYEARYAAKCGVLDNPVTKEMIMTSAKLHSDVIQHLCSSGDCSVAELATPEITCENNQLVIRWPTQTTFKANTDDVPSVLWRSLSRKLYDISKTDLKIIVSTNIPPIVYPLENADDSIVKVVLRRECSDGSTYDAKKETCEQGTF